MSDLASLVDALEARRTEFLAGLDSLPPEQQRQRPTASAWSPVEIGEHLLIAERGLARVAGRQIEKGPDRRRFDAPSAKSIEGLLAAMRTPATFKVPAGAGSIDPTGELSLDELRREWLAVGEQWRAVAETMPPEWADEGLVLHPIAGPMTVAQTVQFLESHIEHHLHQLGRTVRALNGRAA